MQLVHAIISNGVVPNGQVEYVKGHVLVAYFAKLRMVNDFLSGK